MTLNVSELGWISVTGLAMDAPITGLSVVETNTGVASLIVAGAMGSGLISYRLDRSGQDISVTYQPYPDSDAGLSGLEILQIDNTDGSTLVLPLGPVTGGAYSYTLSESLGAATAVDTQGYFDNIGRITAAVTSADGDSLITATTSGLWSWTFTQATTLARGDMLELDAAADQVTAVALVEQDNHNDILLAAVTDGNQIQSYSLGADASLTMIDQIGASDGVGIATPTALITAELENKHYAVLASATSQSLSVFTINWDGTLSLSDHITDNTSSYFAGASHLAQDQYGDWTLIAAAGNDGGVSLFALLPGGLLSPLTHSPWQSTDGETTATTGLAGLDIWVIEDALHIYAAASATSRDARGVYVMSFDLSQLGLILHSQTARAQINGSSGNDIFTAQAANQTLTGGEGDDMFIFTENSADADGTLGQISDFTSDMDQIDLSALPLLRNASQITLQQDGSDLILHYGEYNLRLRNVSATEFDLNTDLSFSAARSLPNLTDTIDDPTLYGTAAANTLEDDDSNGVLLGYDGNDRLIGNGGNDWIEAGTGTDTLNGGNGHDTLIGGDSVNDLRDVIYAGAGNDSIDGGYGNDLLYGQDGNDTIAGGWGADEVIGQGGDDVLNGAVYSDLVYGGDGRDFINGGFGHDRINGGAGADVFYHLGIVDHGSDWIQDYTASDDDVLLFAQSGANINQFQINYAHTSNAAGERSGQDNIAEAFVTYRPTGQIVWALVDGAAQDDILLRIAGNGTLYDLV